MKATTRRDFLRTAGLAGVAPWVLRSARTKGNGLNVLFIAVDDLRPQLGCYGHPEIRSPNIDRLASEGFRFDRAYCQQALCAPSRTSLLTGLRPDTTRVYDLSTPLKQALPGVVSLPRHFKNHGYETVSLGKVYHHRGDDPAAWSRPDWRPEGDWAGAWRAYRDPASVEIIRRHDAELKAAYEAALAAGKKPKPPVYGVGPPFEAPNVPDEAYPDGLIARRAVEELRGLRDRPFFLAVGFLKPHLPFNAPKCYWDLYDPDEIQLPELDHWPERAPEIALTDWSELRAYAGIPQHGPVSRELARKLIHGYLACVSFTDAQIGKLLDELDRLGLRRKTIVILWGDHGWKLGEYGAWCKHTNFELDTNAPLLLSVPGERHAGKSTSALVEFVDIYPTLAELCDLPIPGHCEGVSLVPLLEDPGRPWKEAAFSQYPRDGGKVMGYTLRTARWRYTEWIDRKSGRVVARELYDHAKGPVARGNLAGLKQWEPTVRELSRLLDRGRGWRAVQARLKARLANTAR